MERRFCEILAKSLRTRATDVHFQVDEEGRVTISLRTISGMMPIKPDVRDIRLFNFLQYQAHLDISALNRPQSGSFSYFYRGRNYDFRMAVLRTPKLQSGVLRILSNHASLSIADLSDDSVARKAMEDWLALENGLVVLSGPTGSGKTTALYTILSQAMGRTIYSLEDPIEAIQDGFVQLEINERIGFTYAEGIKQILRHDPDIIMIGEIRDEIAARMAVRAALTGCLVITTIHAASINGAIDRLLELGVGRGDLADTAQAVSNQRLMKRKGRLERVGLFDILQGEELRNAIISGTRIPDRLPEKIEEGKSMGLWDQAFDVQKTS